MPEKPAALKASATGGIKLRAIKPPMEMIADGDEEEEEG